MDEDNPPYPRMPSCHYHDRPEVWSEWDDERKRYKEAGDKRRAGGAKRAAERREAKRRAAE